MKSAASFLAVLALAAIESIQPVPIAAAVSNVRVTGLSFSPRDLTIAPGDTVTFTGGGGFHTVTGDGAEPFCGPGAFTTCSVTFSNVGVYAYHCIPHQSFGMVGVIRVVEPIFSPLTVSVSGNGFVSPDFNGQSLLVGGSFTVTATPAAGSAFVGWTGGITSSTPRLTFVMQSNLVLQANFVLNPFLTGNGVYNGLFNTSADTNGLQPCSSGFFTFKLSLAGKYSGSLQLAGRKRPFTGQFNLDGRATNAVKRAGTNDLTLELALDTGSDSGRVTGRLVDPIAGWTAGVTGDHAPVFASTSSSRFQGSYTIAVTPEAGEPGIGDGFGTVTVDAKGTLKLKATLADGTAATQSVPVSKDGQWPLYVAMAGGKGSLFSRASLATNPAAIDSIEGRLGWIRTAQPAARLYSGGFTSVMDLVGSTYHPPGTNVILPFATAAILFDGGNLTTGFSNVITLAPKGKVANLTTNQPLVMSFTLLSGLFKGSVKLNDAGADRRLLFKGAALQNQEIGVGFFTSTNKTGPVRIQRP